MFDRRRDGDWPWRVDIAAPGYGESRVDALPESEEAYDIGAVLLLHTTRLEGCVSDERGSPIVGARVYGLLGTPEDSSFDPAAALELATTDANGSYSCERFAPGLVSLGAAAAGFADGERVGVVLRAGSDRVDFTLGPERPLELVVIDSRSAPIAGASARLYDEPRSKWPRHRKRRSFWRGAAASDAHGRIVIAGAGERSDAWLDVEADGFAPRSFHDGFVPPRGLVRLERAPVFAVRSQRKGAEPPPLAWVGIRDSIPDDSNCCLGEDMHWWEYSPGMVDVEVVDEAHWNIRWTANGESAAELEPQMVQAMSADFALAEFVSLPPKCGREAPFEVELVFEPGLGSIGGQVTDSEGSGLGGVEVVLQPPRRSSPRRTLLTDADGAFEFLGIGGPTGAGLYVDDPVRGRGHQLVTPDAGESVRDVKLQLSLHDLPRRVFGRVTRGGRAVEEPVVLGVFSLRSGGSPRSSAACTTSTDANGEYRLETTWQGAHAVLPMLPPDPDVGAYRRFWDEFPDPQPADCRWKFDLEPGQQARVDVELDDLRR